MDDLVVALGADPGISKSEVSRICEQLDESVGGLKQRGLAVFSWSSQTSTPAS